MASSEAREVKCIITGLLVSSPLRCTIKQLCADFANTEGYGIPFQRLGFKSVEDYLRSIPDTVRIYGSGLFAEVEAVVKPQIAHINELVAKQKKDSIPKSMRRRIKRNDHFCQPSTSGYQRINKPSYPNTPNQSWQINNFDNSNPNHTQQIHNFDDNSPNQTRPINNFNINSPNQTRQINNFDNSIPNHTRQIHGSDINSPNQIRQINNFDNNSPNYSQQKSSTPESQSSREKEVDSCEKDLDDRSDLSSDVDEYETRVPPRIQNNLKKLILKFPDGIPCTKLQEEYRKMFNKKLSFDKYNYRSVIEMCSDLPEIFNYIQLNSIDFILYDRNKTIPFLGQNDMATAQYNRSERVGGNVFSEMPKLDWESSLALIPSDVLLLSDRIPRYFPDDVKEGDYLDICVGEIYDISKFWIYMLFGGLSSLMSELQEFFKINRNKYLIPEPLLAEGLYCTTLYANEYHRSVIVNLLPTLPGFVRVLFIDYGTVGNVPSNEIWYLPKQFSKVPCQAIRARLSNIYPTHENRTWSVQAVNRFKELITNTALVAEIIKLDKNDHALEIYLADVTNEQDIFFINDKLVKEGHALYPDQEQKKSLIDPYCIPLVNYIHLYPEFYEIESGNAPTSPEMNYIVNNKVPLHQFMPQYFEVHYHEDADYVQRKHEEFNRSVPNVKMKPFTSEDFDYSLFPEEMLEDISELVKQEEADSKPVGDQKAKETVVVPKTEVKETVVLAKTELNDGESERDDSVREYCCNRKRISELLSGERSADSDSVGDLSGELSSLHLSQDGAVPLNNTLSKLVQNNSDLAVINNVTKPSKSTNPFLSDEDSADANPFRRTTNPFLSDIEDTIGSTGDLFEIYAKPPLEKKVNNLNKVNKQLNVDRPASTNPFEADKAEGGRAHQVRTPPGFSSSLQQSAPSWNTGAASVPLRYDGLGNPYYQRFPQYTNMFAFSVNQSGPGMMPDCFNFMQPYFPNQYQFNLQFLQQALAAQHYAQQTAAPPHMKGPGNFSKIFRKH